MPLSEVALMCLQSSLYFRADMLVDTWVPGPVDQSNNIKWQKYYEDLRNKPEWFLINLSISMETFDYILEHVRAELNSLELFHYITPEAKLIITLKYLASGTSLMVLSSYFQPYFQTAPNTTHKVIFFTLKAMWKKLSIIHLFEPTPSEMHTLATQFYEKWGFPNCIGAIGGRYVCVEKREIALELKKNRSKKCIVLSAIVDANFRFIAVDVISKKNQDKEDSFNELFKNAGLQCLPGTDMMFPIFIIGDETYPLKNYLMKPYLRIHTAHCECKTLFNNKLKQARVPLYCAFEILTEKWGIYTKPFVLNLRNSTLVIKVTCLLHNIIKDIDGRRDMHFSRFGEIDTGSLNFNLVTHRSKRNNRPAAISMEVRDQLREYIRSQHQQTTPSSLLVKLLSHT